MKREAIIFSTAYLPMIGGAEVAIKEITEKLGDDFDFKLITARIKKGLLKEEKIGKIEIYRVGFGYSFDKYLLPFLGVLKALKINNTNKKEKPIIWAIMASFGGFGALFLKILKPKWPFLLTLQEGDSEEHILRRVGFFYPIWKMIFKKADYIQAISNYLKDFALRHGAGCQIEVVPNGVDVKKFKVESYKVYKAKEKIGIKNDEKIILTVSRLEEKNGVDVLIRAIDELKVIQRPTQDVKVKLVIIGEGKERKKLERLVNQLNLEKEIIFAGEVKLEEIAEYYKIADVFCRPSRTEGFGNVFIEAMAAGVPVVATNVGGIKDFLKDGENGLVLEIDSPKDTAEKIKVILEDDELREKIIEGEKKTAEKYDWNIISLKMEKIIEKLGLKDKKKNILIATPIYPPEAGGPATYAKGIKKELEDEGISVSVLSYGKGGGEAEFVSKDNIKGWRHFLYFLKIFRRARKADVIYALDATAAGLPAAMAAMLRRRKFLARIGGDLLWERAAESGFFYGTMEDFYKSGKFRGYKKWIYKVIKFVLGRAEAVIVPAENLAEIYERNYGVDGKKIEVIKNVFEKKIQREKEEETGEPKLLFAGRMVKYKNLESLIEVVGSLKMKFEIIGDGPERESLGRKIKDLGLDDKIAVKKEKRREELEKKIERERIIGVSLAWTEFNPNFILECLSKRRPVLISRKNGLSVNLPEEFLADPFNKKEIEEKIKKIIENYDFYREKISGINLEFTWKQSADKFISLIDKEWRNSDYSRSAQFFK